VKLQQIGLLSDNHIMGRPLKAMETEETVPNISLLIVDEARLVGGGKWGLCMRSERRLLSGMKNKSAYISQAPSHTDHSDEHVTVGPFRIRHGTLPLDPMDDYILTPSVQSKLIGFALIVCTRRFPVLIEGPTLAGKTSSIEYLTRHAGHQFVRINNHEHTDIQEYIRSYVSDPNTGKLVFRDGILVRALRPCSW
jgi:midasin